MIDLKTTLDFHKDHKSWDSEVSLYLTEIKTFEKKLSQLQSQLKNPEQTKSFRVIPESVHCK